MTKIGQQFAEWSQSYMILGFADDIDLLSIVRMENVKAFAHLKRIVVACETKRCNGVLKKILDCRLDLRAPVI